MKLPFVFILLIFSCKSNSKKEVSDTNTVISITYDNGDRQSNLFIGPDSLTIARSFQNDESVKVSIETYFKRDHFQSTEFISYIQDYILKSCSRIDPDSARQLPPFTIRIYSKDKKETCYLYKKKEILNYWQGMLKWIEIPIYKSENGKLIEQIKLYLKLVETWTD